MEKTVKCFTPFDDQTVCQSPVPGGLPMGGDGVVS
jgi:hypothetical protein